MAMKIDTTQPLYSTREVARLLGVSLKTVQLWVDNGILDAWKTVGGHRRITFESVERLRNAGQSISSAQQPIHLKETFLARQPILDRRQRIVAYELLYRNEAADHAKITDHTEASARVISYAFSELGLGIAYLTQFSILMTSIVTFAVMSISIIGVLQTVLNKRKIQCACLGAVFNLPMSTVTIIEDGLMITMSAIMLILL